MACSEKHGMKAVLLQQIYCKTIYISPCPTLSPLGPSRIWGAILMRQRLIRFIQEPLFVTETEHKKESLCISQKHSDGSVIFSTLFSQASK